MNYQVGADPEVFLQDAAESLIAVFDKIGGTKQFPKPLPIGEGFLVQEDNVAVEFNIPPARSAEELAQSMDRAMVYLRGFFQEKHGLTFSKSSAALFPMEQLNHPMAFEFGCEPDYNAWTRRRNPRPKAVDHRLRSAGGHVHVGYENPNKQRSLNIIKAMDLFMGVPSVLMDEGEARKELYGKAGACRIKSYGVEYRSLSNFWIFDDKLIKWVWSQTGKAIEASETMLDNIEQDQDLIVGAINNNDKGIADHLMNKYNIQYA